MDNAVALVQTYLRVNGYFTVAEYPVIEAVRRGGYRTATDLDLLAFRFPRAAPVAPGGAGAPDPALGAALELSDMIIGEVKEGRAVLNDAATRPAVLRAALERFGCCPPPCAATAADALLRDGRARMPSGHWARLVVFGSTAGDADGRAYHVVALGHVVRFLQEYVRERWDALRHTDHKDPVFGFLMTMEKALRGVT